MFKSAATIARRGMATVETIQKSHTFTEHLPADPQVPTVDAAEVASDELVRSARLVKNALFTWVAPRGDAQYVVLSVSKPALETIGLAKSEATSETLQKLVSGNFYWREHYPWAQCYGGYQFGEWAAQLGDGRAMSIVEMTNKDTHKRYEIQLKGAGKTPYSRFADGNAVVRSSIREYLVSEHLHALGIPTTRALALTYLPERLALREEGLEKCAIVTRFAESWLRIGTFDLFRHRGDRVTLRRLADYCIEHVFGRDTLPDDCVNVYEALYRECCRRNAKTVALWQAYGFMNGVLNTDNTSIYGLSMDFGPFAFMDTFEPAFTPNHDDHMIRYSYKMQPTIVWWNLTRLGEALSELFTAGDMLNSASFVAGEPLPESSAEERVEKGTDIIRRAGELYKATFLHDYQEHMRKRLGFTQAHEDTDFDTFGDVLDLLEANELDFPGFFSWISRTPVMDIDDINAAKAKADAFLPDRSGMIGNFGANGRASAVESVAAWLLRYRERLSKESSDDMARMQRMQATNPHFLLRGWVLQDVISRFQSGDHSIVDKVLQMATAPFNETWGIDDELEKAYCSPPPSTQSGLQCSCSS